MAKKSNLSPEPSKTVEGGVKLSSNSSESVNTNESNSLWGNQVLGNQMMVGGKNNAVFQLLYTTISNTTASGQQVDVTTLTQNSTVMACANWLARSLAQMKPRVRVLNADTGDYEDALSSQSVSRDDKRRAKQIHNLLRRPNNFQSSYEFMAQFSLWLTLTGEVFILNWRANQADAASLPMEMYILDSTLITSRVNENRYPTYRLSSPSYGFNKENELFDHQVTHVMEGPWQGSSGFNKLIQAAELINLSQSIDQYANFSMANGAKPTGVFSSDQPINDAKIKELAARLKESWNSLNGSRDVDLSKPGQAMILESGFKYTPIEMLTLQDQNAAELKKQVDQRICGLMGVPPMLVGVTTDAKFNNSATARDEAYRSTLWPMLEMLGQKLTMSLCRGYQNLVIDWDTSEFLKGATLEQMQYSVSGVTNGIMTPNEARSYLGLPQLEGQDELQGKSEPAGIGSGGNDAPLVRSPQDTGDGGGGSKVTRLPVGRVA